MPAEFNITTTGTAAAVPLGELGGMIHPSSVDLFSLEPPFGNYSFADIMNNTAIQDAVVAGEITVTDENGDPIDYLNLNTINNALLGGGDHGTLTGLGDDDHIQYHTDARGDARYYLQGQIDTFLTGKSDIGHTHSTYLESVVAGTAITIDNTDPQNPIINGVATNPGGSNTQIQFNDSGSFGGDADFTYTDGTDETDTYLDFDGVIRAETISIPQNTSYSGEIGRVSLYYQTFPDAHIGVDFAFGDKRRIKLGVPNLTQWSPSSGGIVALNGLYGDQEHLIDTTSGDAIVEFGWYLGGDVMLSIINIGPNNLSFTSLGGIPIHGNMSSLHANESCHAFYRDSGSGGHWYIYGNQDLEGKTGDQEILINNGGKFGSDPGFYFDSGNIHIPNGIELNGYEVMKTYSPDPFTTVEITKNLIVGRDDTFGSTGIEVRSPGTGKTAYIELGADSDEAGIYVTSYNTDETEFAFMMKDNPDTVEDFFVWKIVHFGWWERWKDWQPLKFGGYDMTINAINCDFNAALTINNGPRYWGGGSQAGDGAAVDPSIDSDATGGVVGEITKNLDGSTTGDLELDLSGFTAASELDFEWTVEAGATTYELEVDGYPDVSLTILPGTWVTHATGLQYRFIAGTYNEDDKFGIKAFPEEVCTFTGGVEVQNTLTVATTTGVFNPPEMTTAQRNAIASPGRGIIFNTDTNKHQGYDGTTWNDLY